MYVQDEETVAAFTNCGDGKISGFISTPKEQRKFDIQEVFKNMNQTVLDMLDFEIQNDCKNII